MDDPDHLTQTTAVVDRALPSISEVRKAIEDHILTLEPRLKILNQHVSDHVTLMEAATLTIDRSSRIRNLLTKNTKPTMPFVSF
jgi:predicted component of type VI protein secretion system